MTGIQGLRCDADQQVRVGTRGLGEIKPNLPNYLSTWWLDLYTRSYFSWRTHAGVSWSCFRHSSVKDDRYTFQHLASDRTMRMETRRNPPQTLVLRISSSIDSIDSISSIRLSRLSELNHPHNALLLHAFFVQYTLTMLARLFQPKASAPYWHLHNLISDVTFAHLPPEIKPPPSSRACHDQLRVTCSQPPIKHLRIAR